MFPAFFWLFLSFYAVANSALMPQCTFGLDAEKLDLLSILNADLVCKLEFFPDSTGLSVVGATRESFAEVYKHEFRLFNVTNSCNRSPFPFTNGRHTFLFALQWFCGRFCYESAPKTFVEMDCMYEKHCPMPPYLCKCLDVNGKILTQKVVRPGQLLNQYDTACLNCYHSDLGNVDRADKCDKTWEAVVRRKTGRSVTEEPETIITGTSEAQTQPTTTPFSVTVINNKNDSNFMIRKGFNFGCNLLEIEGPIEKCQSACNTRPDCLSFQHTAGKCSLKNCVTDTVMKGIFGEDFHVKESYFLSRETELFEYELKFGTCEGLNVNGNFLTGTLDDCANYCDKESKCKGFWFMSNTCQLKTEMCDSLEKRGLGDMYYVKADSGFVKTTTIRIPTTSSFEPATTGKGKTSNYLMRAGFNFGCTIVELVRSDLKLCQNECDDRPDCSSLQWSESGFCALKNCLTDTIIKGDVGETFYVKESFFAEKEAEVSGYQLRFGSCDDHSLDSIVSGTPKKCGEICSSNPACKGFWYMSELCQMKDGICPTVTQRGTGDMYYVQL